MRDRTQSTDSSFHDGGPADYIAGIEQDAFGYARLDSELYHSRLDSVLGLREARFAKSVLWGAKMAKRSGIVPVAADIPTMNGMVARGDRNHDIAAWFGWNQGRVKEAKDGRYGQHPTVTTGLPPSGAPGIKGRRLRAAVDQALAAKTLADAVTILKAANARYDTNE